MGCLYDSLKNVSKNTGDRVASESFTVDRRVEKAMDEDGKVDMVALVTDGIDGFVLTVDLYEGPRRWEEFFGIAWGEYDEVEGDLYVIKFEGLPVSTARDALHDMLLGYESGELWDKAENVVELEVIERQIITMMDKEYYWGIAGENIDRRDHFTIYDVILAEFTLEPMKCLNCGQIGYVVFLQYVGDASCEYCGAWQLEDIEHPSGAVRELDL